MVERGAWDMPCSFVIYLNNYFYLINILLIKLYVLEVYRKTMNIFQVLTTYFSNANGILVKGEPNEFIPDDQSSTLKFQFSMANNKTHDFFQVFLLLFIFHFLN